jgi:hypothetical protein
MNKLIYVAVAVAAASGIAAAPAVAGLSNNPSFSHQLPVRVPSGAQPVIVGNEHSLAAHRSPSASPSAKDSRGPEAEAGDDRAQDVPDNDVNDHDVNDVNDDHGAVAEPGDDNGHDGAGVTAVTPPSAGVTQEVEPEPGDDKGSDVQAVKTVAASPAPQPVDHGDDKGAATSGRTSGSSGNGGGGDH